MILIVFGFVLLVAAAIWLSDVGWLVNAFAAISIVGAPVAAWSKLRVHGAKPSLLTIVVATAAAAVYAWIFVGIDTDWYWKALLLVLMAAPIMSVANAGFRRDVRRAQTARDDRAAALSRQVLNGVDPPGGFTLYLRPFVSTDRLGVQALPSEFSTEVPVHLDLESVLRRAVEKHHPLVALGRRGDTTEGAARIVTDDVEWRSVIIELIARASLIVMVPMAHEGTIWELRHLIDTGLLSKVVLAMPETVSPTPSGVVQFTEESDRLFDAGIQRYSHAEHSMDLRQEWEEICEAAADLHLALPAYANCGALFTIDEKDGQVRRIVPLPLSTLARRVTAVTVMLSGLAQPITAESSIRASAISAIRSGLPMRRGRTLEYNLVRGADGFVQWGRPDDAASLLRESAQAGRRKRAITRWYLASMRDFVRQANEIGKPEIADRYTKAATVFATDPGLSVLVSPASSIGSGHIHDLPSQ